MSYKVTFWNGEAAAQPAKFYISRSQAVHGMKLFAYDKLASFGKLDTPAAHACMMAIVKCDDILQPQESRCIKISNTGFDMVLSNTARSPR